MVDMKEFHLANFRMWQFTLNSTTRFLSGSLILAGSFSALSSQCTFAAPQPITGLTASYKAATSTTTLVPGAPSSSFSVPTSYAVNFGKKGDLVVQDVQIGGANYSFQQVANFIGIRRVISPSSTVQNERHIIQYETLTTETTSPLNLAPTSIKSMEEALLGDVINRGADNVFVNTGEVNGNNNNIERIDVLSTTGITTPSNSTLLTKAGFVIFERNGSTNSGDPFKIVAITKIDAANNPIEFGRKVVAVTSPNWGSVAGYRFSTTVIRKDNGPGDMSPSAQVREQSIGGIFISYADLGMLPSEKIYGYALVADDFPLPPISATQTDITNRMTNLNDVSNFPLSTSNSTGGLDLFAGGVSFTEYPTTNLSISKTDNKSTLPSGSNTSYEITVTNNGRTMLTNLFVRDILPSGIYSPSFTPSTGLYDPTTGAWTGLNLKPKESITLAISAIINPSFVGNLLNKAIVSPPTGVEDYYLDDNEATDATTIIAGPPALSLVKRVTQVRTTTLIDLVDKIGTSIDESDTNIFWPDRTGIAIKSNGTGSTALFSNFLKGKVDATNLLAVPGDEIEYTIYFLSNGGQTAKGASICDFIPVNTTYVDNSLVLVKGTTIPTPISDLTGDVDGGAYPIGTVQSAMPSACNTAGSTYTSRGAVVVNIGDIPNATTSGSPGTSYGYIRFRVKLN
jgi:uncharacterized repeat protein (TIGR01451 family)